MDKFDSTAQQITQQTAHLVWLPVPRHQPEKGGSKSMLSVAFNEYDPVLGGESSAQFICGYHAAHPATENYDHLGSHMQSHSSASKPANLIKPAGGASRVARSGSDEKECPDVPLFYSIATALHAWASHLPRFPLAVHSLHRVLNFLLLGRGKELSD